MSDYVTLTLKVGKEDLKEYLTNFYDEKEIERMNIEREASECISGMLEDHISDFFVIDDSTLVVGDF